MIKHVTLTVAALLVAVSAASAADECQVPKGMKKEQKLPCIRAGGFMVDQPSLTLAELTNGPGFDAADPVASRWAYFTDQDDITCYFRPHYAFKQVQGKSLKFQCWHTSPERVFFDGDGQKIAIDDVKIVIEKDKGENRSYLYAKSDTANANEIKPDRVKVKYLKPAHPNHDKRYNEVFTEIAAGRILWALGFPADGMYPVAAADCVGCTADPFGDNLKDNTASLHATPVEFKIATVERQLPWDDIDPENDETWSWADAASFYSTGAYTREQKVAYDAYRLALGLFNYHNAIDIQNRVACAEWVDEDAEPKVCRKPMIFVQDLGSSFGKAKSFIFGTNPRGSFSDWQSQTVFSKPDTCELRASLDGDKQVLKESQDLMVKRLQSLDRERVKAIFKVARFGIMDQKQLQRLRDSGVADVPEAALNEWTDVFMSRIAEIGAARNCKS